MIGCNFRTVQNFLDSDAHYRYPQIKIRPFIDFTYDRRLNIVYDLPFNKGKCRDLSLDKIKKMCGYDGYKRQFKRLFRNAILLKAHAKGNKRATLVCHVEYNASDILCMIEHWEPLFNYLYKHRLMLSIYDGPNMGFMVGDTMAVIVLEYKDDLDFAPVSECEIIRVYDQTGNLIQRRLICTSFDNVQETVIDDVELKFSRITLNKFGVWTPPDPYDRSILSGQQRLLLQ